MRVGHEPARTSRGERYTMNETINIVRLRQPDELDDTLRGVLRSATRRLLAQAVEMEAEAFLAARRPRCARNLWPTTCPLERLTASRRRPASILVPSHPKRSRSPSSLRSRQCVGVASVTQPHPKWQRRDIMVMNGQERIPAPVDVVLRELNDPRDLMRCIPGAMGGPTPWRPTRSYVGLGPDLRRRRLEKP